MEFLFLHLLTHSFFCSPGTPYLSVYLESPPGMIWEERITITMKVAYEGLTNENGEAVLAEAKPIIIRNLPFDESSNFQLHRRCHDYDMWDSDDEGPEWERYFDEQRNHSYKLVDGPDIEVNVADETLFLCLQPGGRWTEVFTLISVIYTRIQRSVAPIGSSIGAATLNGGFWGAGKNMLIQK